MITQDRSVPLEELASVTYFSPFHFHFIFVAIVGETVRAFTGGMRNEEAARLLKFSQKSVAEIAAEYGFSSATTK